MVFLPDRQSRQNALDFARVRPLEGVDPGFMARFKSDMDSMRFFSNSNAERLNQADAVSSFQREFYQASGQTMKNWISPDPQAQVALEQQARSQFEAWKQNNPDSDLAFPEPEALKAQAENVARLKRDTSERLAMRSTSWSSAAGGFLGTMVGAMTDPVNAASMMVGAGAASGVVRTALVEAGIGAASETVIQGMTRDFKSRVAPDFGLEDAAYEVGAAAAGGAVFGGGVKALAKAWSGASNRYFPRHVKDAGNVMERDAFSTTAAIGNTTAERATSRSALEKAAEDIMAGRPVELPPEAFTQSQARIGRVYDAEGGSIGVRYEIVEAADLITSHGPDFRANPAFPPELQPRDRTRAISQDQVQSIYSNLQPERLGPSPQAESGAPIVGADNLVESGNARVMALVKAHGENGIQAGNYRNYLKSQGFDVDGFTAPVLVGRRVTDMDPASRVRFVTAANRSTAMRLGATEQALADARLFDNKVLDALAESDIDPLRNQNFTRGFLSRLPRSEQGGLVDADGRLSVEGERRITAAMMARAYGDATLLSRALEETDGNIKAIAGAMADVAGSWAKMRDAVGIGQLPRGMDITENLLEAVRLVMRSRDEKVPMSNFLRQPEMFNGPAEVSKIIVRSLFSDGSLKRGTSRQNVSFFLRAYADEALKNDAGPRLVGEALGPEDVLRTALQKAKREDLLAAAENAVAADRAAEIADDPITQDAVIMEAERMRAEGRGGIMVDLEDGNGPRALDDIMNEADDELAASAELESCATGIRPEADGS